MGFRPTALLSLAALALGACAGPAQTSKPELVDARTGRVVVAPLNLVVSTPPELDGDGDLAWQQLLQYFVDRGQQVAVLEPASADALWIAATRGLDLDDRTRALRSARARLARLLAEHDAYDLLVVPSLVLRPARVQGSLASWDGVRRSVPRTEEAISPADASLLESSGAGWAGGMRGELAAASLHVAILDREGRTTFEGLGGLDLAREPHRDTRTGAERWTSEPRPEPLSDPEHLREGIELAFDGALPQATSPALAAQRP